MFIMKYSILILMVLISVAFFTLLERKILGYSHNRMGPNKLGYWGIFQPFSDALKLFSKEDLKFNEVNYSYYMFSPVFGIFLMLIIWGVFPFWGGLLSSNYSFVFFILISGFSVYFLLYSGWSTSTKFSLLGSFRSSAQSVSYEVIMILCFLVLIFTLNSLDMVDSYLNQINVYMFIVMPFLGLLWFISCLAESNRTPFDFSEGESELVSGFNTEYGGGLFSLIFIGEYSSIIFLSFLTSFLFFGGKSFFLFSIFFSLLFLWVRCSFPRLRYDNLMMMSWKGLMILSLGFLFVYMGF